MPKLWRETVAAHRREVGDAILDATIALVEAHGLRGVTMSQIADATGIGRATLYKYYPDVESILRAWHERHVAMHLEQVEALCRGPGTALHRFSAVLEAYAFIRHAQPKGELFAALHHGEDVAEAHGRLLTVVRRLLSECVEAGKARRDASVNELATFCIHAIGAASNLPSKSAVRRLVTVIVAGIKTPR